MPSRNRGSNRGRNNNPEGRNQHSSAFNFDTARERPLATAAAIGGAVAAGVFLWSRRNQISEQLSELSEQIGEWTSGRPESEFETVGATEEFGTAEGSTASRRSIRGGMGLSETGGGTSSLGAHSGGGGTSASPSGRGRAKSGRTNITR